MSCSSSEPASAWVRRWAALVPAGCSVLDLACGAGRHAIFFAQRGCRVTAVDIDPACANALVPWNSIRFLDADLEQRPWPLAAHQFDSVVVTRYLHRPLWPHLLAALADGGVLIYETFADGQQDLGRPRNPDFLLQAGELLTVCRELHVLAFEDGVAEDGPARVQRICALKPPFGQDKLALGRP